MSSKLHSISTSCHLNFTASQLHVISTSQHLNFMSSKLHSISTSCHLNFTASQSYTPSTSRRFMFSCNSVSLCVVKMLHQGVAGAFSWSTCCSQWLNHCVKVISISVVFLLSCFSVLQVMALFRSVELRPGDSG